MVMVMVMVMVNLSLTKPPASHHTNLPRVQSPTHSTFIETISSTHAHSTQSPTHTHTTNLPRVQSPRTPHVNLPHTHAHSQRQSHRRMPTQRYLPHTHYINLLRVQSPTHTHTIPISHVCDFPTHSMSIFHTTQQSQRQSPPHTHAHSQRQSH